MKKEREKFMKINGPNGQNKGYLICDKCGGYYKLEEDESPDDFVLKCKCGGELKVFNSFDENYNSNLLVNLD